MIAVNGSNGILEERVKFAIQSYIGRKGFNSRWLDKHCIDRWRREYCNHIMEVTGNVVSFHHSNNKNVL